MDFYKANISMSTFSQNSSMVEVGRTPWVHQEHPEHGAQDHIQTAFEDLCGRPLQPLDNLCQDFVTCTVKKCFWYSHGTSCVLVCAQCFLFWHLALLKESSSILFSTPVGKLMRSSPSLLFSRLNTPALSYLRSRRSCSSVYNSTYRVQDLDKTFWKCSCRT